MPDTDRAGEAAAEAPATARAAALLAALAGTPSIELLNEARDLVKTLRDLRAYGPMGRLAEAVRRVAPDDLRNRCWYAQCLIESGFATVAIDTLRAAQQAMPPGAPEAAEAWGLLGRAHKQIFFDCIDRAGVRARQALAAAIDAYRQPYESDPKHNSWHGVNLLALLSRARREGWDGIAPEIDVTTLAGALVATLLAMPKGTRDEWYEPTLAEATLGLSLAAGDLQPVETQLRGYLGAPSVHGFQVASTLRQFSEVWGLEALTLATPGTGLRDTAEVERARGLVAILRARLLQLPGGELTLSAASIQQTATRAQPDRSQLEAILGVDGPQTYAWWQAGIAAARSVGIVRQRLGKRLGTGFLVRSGDFGLEPAARPLLLTNFHVVNPTGEAPGIRPELAEVIFEAADATRVYNVSQLLWSSPIELHDASLLSLAELPNDIAPLSIATTLPSLESTPVPRVYIIGYPGGRELAFSFQDNALLDHEGPPAGKPQIEGVWRVHYRAPTEGGNSGSPVFEATSWQVIALHHKGGRFGMPCLNGKPGQYAANEGLALAPLLAAARAALA